MRKPAFTYHLDEMSAHCIRGWVRRSRFSKPVNVSVYFEGKLVGLATAAQFRPDLKEAGIGHGHYGFEITPNVNRVSLDPLKIEIFFDNEFVESCDITPDHDETLRGFAKVIEERMDAMLALTRERMQRELDQKLRELSTQDGSQFNPE